MKKIALLLSGLLLTAILFAGCSSSTDNGSGDTLTGEIIAGGSTSTKNIMEATGEEFAALNPDVTFEYNATGSSDGVKGADDGTYMLGTASREIKEDEKAWELTEKIFAYDGIAVVVHPSNDAVADITTEQIAQIFKGEITNWSEVGGANAPIVVVSREDGSGTRGAFEELLGFEDALTKDATIAEGNGNVQSTVAGNENSIGYVSFTYIDDTVKALSVEGVAPTVEDVLNKTYPISRPFVMIYHEDNLSDAAKAYIEFLMSADGQQIVEDEGGIPVE
ncbi:MAG: phosphate ABC transporter substrate-binding protein [Eubacteriaceae bacterium]|nr:phosphate ABC transporter substrate-binding protein [Eubacteriaceae bacterium]